MECYVFDDVLNFAETSYLLKTLNSESQKRIISSVFRGGALVYSRFENYNGQVTDDELFNKVKRYHENSKHDIQALFNFSKKYANSKDLGKRILLVRAFMKNKLYKEATLEISNILDMNPNLSILYYYLGQIRLKLTEYDQAVKCFNKAIELNQDFADYHFYLGRSYLELNECRNAINEFIYAIKLNAYYSHAYYYLGLAYLKNAIVKESFNLAKEVVSNAQNCFVKAVQIYPNFKNQYFIEGEDSLKNDNLEEAYENFSKTLSEDPPATNQDFILDFYIRYLSAEDSLDINEIQEYIAKLKTLIKKFASYADLHQELGIAYLILSKCITKHAKESFEKALAINPNYSDAQRMLRMLISNKNNIV